MTRDSKLTEYARQNRRVPTEPERRLWQALRDDALGVRFRRQHPVPPHVADFACVPARLVVEIDGWTHDAVEDAARDASLAMRGWRVLRISNSDVMQNLAGVLDAIRLALQPPPP